MKYVRHFLEYGLVGLSVAGADISDVFSLSDPQILQASRAKYLGDRYLPYPVSFLATNRRDGIGINPANADALRADCEIRFGFEWNGLTGSGATSGACLGGRVSGTFASSTGYFGDLRLFANTIALVKRSAGADTDLATAAFTFAANTVYHAVLRINGTTQSFKVWKDSDPEPAGWTITAADATIASAGLTLAGKVCGAAGGSVEPTIGIWYLSTATGSDSSPVRPKTWQEYLDFLSLQDTPRCVLVEADPLGQDSAGNALTARVCMSNMGYVSYPEDRYPNTCYEEILLQAPKIRRRMTEAFTGRSTMSYGDLIFKNEVVNPDVQELTEDYAGRLDRWFSWNWDGRAIRQLVGHQTWRRCDFKTELLGQVQDIYRPEVGKGGFKLRGPDALFQKPLTTFLIGGSGPNAAALAPYLIGGGFNMEPILYDANSLTYQLDLLGGFPSSDASQVSPYLDVRDGGVSLTQAQRTITAVNAATDTLTSDAAHNLVVGATWVGSGSLPAPLVTTQKYYVKTVPSSTTFTLSSTSGGATIDITGATTGGTFIGRLYDFSSGRISLLTAPAGRITVDFNNSYTVSNACAQALTQVSSLVAGGMAPDTFHGQNIATAVAGWYSKQITIGEVLDQFVTSVGASWNLTREGLFFLFQLGIPGNVAAWTLNADDVSNWRVGARLMPAYVERLGYKKNSTIMTDADLLGAAKTPANRDLYGRPYTLAAYAPSESGLEQPANHNLARSLPERETMLVNAADAATESQRLYALRRKVTATFFFNTGAWALGAELGDNVLLTYPRDGFYYGKNATIVGITEDAARGTAEVEIFCQVDGQWPVVASANPFASEAYY